MTEEGQAGLPARNYSWPPFEPGHELSTVHGAYSPRKVDPLALELLEAVLSDPATEYLKAARWRPALLAWAKAEAQAQLLGEYLAKRGEESGDGVGDLDDDRVKSAYLLLHRAESRAESGRSQLGLTPLSAARLGRDKAAAGVDVAQIMAQLHALDQQQLRERGGGAMSVSVRELEAARRDPAIFARELLKVELFDHQVAVIRSAARYRVLCWGRRCGKTVTMGVLALHLAFSRPGSKVLIVSAGDLSVKRTHAEISALVTGALGLVESVEDDQTHLLRLSNGSTIESVPQSIRAVRSAEADLLIVDEAGFVDQSVWEAAEPIVGARPGMRVLIASTPWRGPGHFFFDLLRQGLDAPSSEVWGSHLPSTASPLVDRVWLEEVRKRASSDYFAREYEARWTGESGAYFSEAELMDNVADYHIPSLERVREASWVERAGYRRVLPAVGGLDYGLRVDSNVLCLLSPSADHGINEERLGEGGRPMFISHLVGRPNWPWFDFATYVADVAEVFDIKMLASETNGVGDAATAMVRMALQRRRLSSPVAEVWTDMRRKQAGFGRLKALLQRGVLALPREPALLGELRSLEFETTQAGGVRISVPENRGHDDLAMALMQAVSGLGEPEVWRSSASWGWDRDERRRAEQQRARLLERGDFSVTTSGLRVPPNPMPDSTVHTYGWFMWPRGVETSADAAW